MGSTQEHAEQTAPRPTLPLTFSNSFWSADYRTGFSSLYTALDTSLVQSDELIAHVQRRHDLEEDIAEGLLPPALRQDGFRADDGGSLRIGFEALLTQSVNEGRARKALADDLQRTILTPFSAWSLSHAGRIRSSRAQVETALTAWERKRTQVEHLKTAYDDTCRAAAQVEDEVNFSRAQGERGDERARLPPRPDEIDDENTAAPGAAGVISALGRAFSTRRAAPSTRTRTRHPKKDDDSESGDEELREEPDEDDQDGLKSPVALKEAREKARKVWEERAPEVKAGLDWSKSKFNNLLSTVVGPQNLEERLDKTVRDVALAEEKYKLAVDELDSLRLALEETLAANFAYVQRLESDRLRAAASVLKQFHASIAALPKLIDGSLERVGQTLELVRPEKDLRGLMETRRTGPFQPSPVLYTSHYSEPALATFGIDLRKFDETNPGREDKPVPPVLELLLRAIADKGEKVEDAERRKAWLYEVPLAAQHALRSVLNNPATVALPLSDLATLLEPFDLPVLCATVKLWLLELEVPVVSYAAYDELRALYPRRTAGEGDVELGKVAEVVGKLPRVHFEVLRTLIDHLSHMISSTSTSEPLPTYIHKLSLSLSRPLLRPKTETALTLDDRFPAVFLSTILTSPSDLFGAASDIATKHREERYRPRRQRTKPIDQRMRRSNLGLGSQGSVDLEHVGEVLKLQQKGAELSVPTQASVLAVPDQQQQAEAFAASPTTATADEFPPPADTAPAEAPVDKEAERAEKEASEAQEERAATPSDHTEAAFVPPAAPSGGPTETAFEPPTEGGAPSPGEPLPPAIPAVATDEPLSSSSSLKRASGTGRLRGARAPRPPSQVMARVAAFEGGPGGEEKSKRESWTRTRAEVPAGEETDRTE